jgi:hypothetical protein
MPKGSLTEVRLTVIERPLCGQCHYTRMMLVRLTPLPDGSEERTFECQRCNFIETRTAMDPLKSEAVARLTSNIRPPA